MGARGKKRIAAACVCLALLMGCAPTASSPEASPSPAPDALAWVHGFYASSSYSQIHLAGEMDAVSLGWGRMFVDEAGRPYVNGEATQGNLWVVPEGAELATGYLSEHGVDYNLCVFATAAHSYGDTSVLEYLIRPENRGETARVLAVAAEGYGGLTLDFEGLTSAGSREDFTALVEQVRQALPGDKRLSVAVPPDTWYHGYDYRALGELCDRVILMAHDYQWQTAPESRLGTDNTDTPVAPIDLVAQALASATDPDTGVADPSKLALAVAFSSAGVEVDEEGLLLDTTVYHPGPGTLSQRLAQPDAQPGWSEEYAAPYVYYHDEEGRRYRVWYEDARSVAAKIDLALSYGVTGLSLWRLGAIPTYENYDVWSAVLAAREPGGTAPAL